MNVYELSTSPDERPTYLPDLKQLKPRIKTLPAFVRVDTRVRLLDVATSKADIVSMINGAPPVVLKVTRQWYLSARGGLIEEPVTEEP